MRSNEKPKTATQTEFQKDNRPGRAEKFSDSFTPDDLNRLNQTYQSAEDRWYRERSKLAIIREELGLDAQGDEGAPALERSKEYIDSLGAKKKAVEESLSPELHIVGEKPLPRNWESIQALIESNGYESTLASYERDRKKWLDQLYKTGDREKRVPQFSEEWKMEIETSKYQMGEMAEIDTLIEKIREYHKTLEDQETISDESPEPQKSKDAGIDSRPLEQNVEQAMEYNEISADMIAARSASIEAIHKSGLEDRLKIYLQILSDRDQREYIPLAGPDSIRGLYRAVQELTAEIESPKNSIIDLRKSVKALTLAVRNSLDSIPQNRSSSRDDPESLAASVRFIGQLRESIKELTSRLYQFNTNEEVKEMRTSFTNMEDILDKQEDYAKRLYRAIDNYSNGPRY